VGDTLRLDASFVDYALGLRLWSRWRPIVVEMPKGTGRDRHGH
jgi:hypothetical protein